jgi:hypothetical protein
LLTEAISSSEYAPANEGIVSLPPGESDSDFFK